MDCSHDPVVRNVHKYATTIVRSMASTVQSSLGHDLVTKEDQEDIVQTAWHRTFLPENRDRFNSFCDEIRKNGSVTLTLPNGEERTDTSLLDFSYFYLKTSMRRHIKWAWGDFWKSKIVRDQWLASSADSWLREMAQALPDPEALVLAAEEAAEIQARLDETVSAMTEEERKVFNLLYLANMTQREARKTLAMGMTKLNRQAQRIEDILGQANAVRPEGILERYNTEALELFNRHNSLGYEDSIRPGKSRKQRWGHATT